MPAWLKRAGFQANVVWQLSHSAVVGICVAGLPVDLTPLWQLLQVPGATPTWSKRAGVQAVVTWQVSQVLALGIWFVPLPVATVPL
jgi:hypothetical protein